jgi:hypothetical protein
MCSARDESGSQGWALLIDGIHGAIISIRHIHSA